MRLQSTHCQSNAKHTHNSRHSDRDTPHPWPPCRRRHPAAVARSPGDRCGRQKSAQSVHSVRAVAQCTAAAAVPKHTETQTKIKSKNIEKLNSELLLSPSSQKIIMTTIKIIAPILIKQLMVMSRIDKPNRTKASDQN